MGSDITINGVSLESYLSEKREKEKAQEVRQINDSEKYPLYKKARRKLKTYKEENGKVKMYNQREINQTMYKEKMKQALEKGAYRDAVVIQLLCGKNTYIGTRDFANKMRAIGVDIKIKHLTTAIRSALTYIKNSNLFEHLEMYRENPKAFWKYKLKTSSYDTLTLRKAFDLLYGEEELGSRHGKKMSITSEIADTTTEVEKTEVEKTEVEKTEVDSISSNIINTSEDAGKSALADWLSSAFKSSEENGGKLNFIFNGNITININKD